MRMRISIIKLIMAKSLIIILSGVQSRIPLLGYSLIDSGNVCNLPSAALVPDPQPEHVLVSCADLLMASSRIQNLIPLTATAHSLSTTTSPCLYPPYRWSHVGQYSVLANVRKLRHFPENSVKKCPRKCLISSLKELQALTYPHSGYAA